MIIIFYLRVCFFYVDFRESCGRKCSFKKNGDLKADQKSQAKKKKNEQK